MRREDTHNDMLTHGEGSPQTIGALYAMQSFLDELGIRVTVEPAHVHQDIGPVRRDMTCFVTAERGDFRGTATLYMGWMSGPHAIEHLDRVSRAWCDGRSVIATRDAQMQEWLRRHGSRAEILLRGIFDPAERSRFRDLCAAEQLERTRAYQRADARDSLYSKGRSR